jgi:hypothetical protein
VTIKKLGVPSSVDQPLQMAEAVQSKDNTKEDFVEPPEPEDLPQEASF